MVKKRTFFVRLINCLMGRRTSLVGRRHEAIVVGQTRGQRALPAKLRSRSFVSALPAAPLQVGSTCDSTSSGHSNAGSNGDDDSVTHRLVRAQAVVCHSLLLGPGTILANKDYRPPHSVDGAECGGR